jgi:isopenicillin-N epimerase
MMRDPTRVRAAFTLDPATVFLNHGSFGACPAAVQEHQSSLRARLERDPLRFLTRDLEPLLDEARKALGAFLDADPEGLVFVPNATAGVSTVLRSLAPTLGPGDELLTTDHAYNACRNALDSIARERGARVVVAAVPFPVTDDSGDDSGLVDSILAQASSRTRLALLDVVTSPTALVLPIAPLVRALSQRGIDTLVDGAHAPGMVPTAIDALAPAYYTGNCHKWLCAPHGAAFLWVRADRRAAIHPLATSHGANSTRTDRSRFRLEHDWTGTLDPTAYLSVPRALEILGALADNGWDDLRRQGHSLALAGRALLCEALGIQPPCPDHMVGTMASIPLPGPPAPLPPEVDPLGLALYEQHHIQVPVFPWPAGRGRLLRISAAPYNRLDEYEALAAAVPSLLGR